jgi:hypothetical protein
MNYVLPIVGAYLVINGIMIGGQATTAMQQIVEYLSFGFGLLAIGLGALIGAVKTGFARLEKRLPPAPEKQPPAPEVAAPSPPPSEETSLSDRLGSMRPWTAR